MAERLMAKDVVFAKNLSRRLAALSKAVGGQRELARRSGVEPRRLHMSIAREGNPGADLVAKVCEGTGCSEHWLLTGEGEMFPKREGQVRLSEETAPYEANPRHGEALALEKARAEYWKRLALRLDRQVGKDKA